MDLRRLELLRELGDRGSVIAVARATHRTPSAVSQQLKVLEREIGYPLTERRGRGIILTDAGKALARTATDIAAAMQRAEAVWNDFVAAPAGEVTLATFPTAGRMLLPGTLRDAAAHPGLVLVATDRDRPLPEFATLTNDFDIVLGYSQNGPAAWPGDELVIRELFVEPLDVVLPSDHPLTAKKELTPADLAGETWIAVPDNFPYERILSDIERATGTALRVSQRFSDTRIVEAIVAGGLGVAVLPRYTTGGPGSGVELRPLAGVVTERHICALVRRDRIERPSVRLVLDLLQRQADLLAR